MATRPGDVDAGALMWLQRQHGITVEEMDRAVEQESGLRALSGTTGDLKELVDRRHQGEAAATLAVDVYVHRLVGSIAAIAAALGGFDALVFTGGVGEHSAEIRAEVAERLGWLGVSIDAGANDPQSDGGLPDRDLSAPDASRRTLVIEAREDLVIAEETRLALRSPV
jgi:acetate kinase